MSNKQCAHFSLWFIMAASGHRAAPTSICNETVVIVNAFKVLAASRSAKSRLVRVPRTSDAGTDPPSVMYVLRIALTLDEKQCSTV